MCGIAGGVAFINALLTASELWEFKSGYLDILPVRVEMQTGTPHIHVRQYPVSPEGRKGLAPVMEQLLAEGILELLCLPILAIDRAEGKY